MDPNSKKQFILKTLASLEKLHQLHKQVRDIDVSISELYPVTLVENNTFFVFDLNKSGEEYEYKLESPTPMPIPGGVLASFSLDFYNEKSSAIISDEAFNTLKGYIFIFHEFIHCFQWENGERDLRKTLEIERKYRNENNYMWEITHPFPYENSIFINNTRELETYIDAEDYNRVFHYHKQMKEGLDRIDYEYMIWQEWKEGFARSIENIIRHRIGVKTNTIKLQPQFNRVSFYEIGSKYINLLINNNPHLKNDIRELYYKMLNT